MLDTQKNLYLISRYEEKNLQLLDMRLLPPKVLVPDDIEDYKFLGWKVESLEMQGKQVQFLTPSMVALQVNIANESLRKIQELKKSMQSMHHEQNVEDEDISELLIAHTLKVYEFIECAQKAIIFSFTALETFINLSIPYDFVWKKETQKKTELYNKEQIERNVTWREKINIVVNDIYGIPEIKKEKFWSSLMELLAIRNRLIHIKSSDDTAVLKDILNKDIFKICYAGQEYINFITDKTAENNSNNSFSFDKFPIISKSGKVALAERKVDSISPVYIPKKYT